ncbi:MAG: hypothetical protein K9M45_04615 [Kiritimatiellales bacterium]|nr:hypothetical protein [Kiritimatiellales bacterium]
MVNSVIVGLEWSQTFQPQSVGSGLPLSSRFDFQGCGVKVCDRSRPTI